MVNIKFTQYQKFDNNKDIKILDYAEIIKFYNKFEKFTRFKERIMDHEFDLEKLIKYINTKFNNHTLDNSSLIYNLNIEIVEI
ncbi:7887_t:CDS:1, partial [Scutellospora calospora]